MENRNPVKCPENEPLVAYLQEKRDELAQSKAGLSDNYSIIFSKAELNICKCKTPITTPKELLQIQGVGKWLSKKMQPYFGADAGTSENDQLTEKGKKKKEPRRYVPQKNSAAYGLLITLYRGIVERGAEFMYKKELMVATDANGLSHVSIAPEKVKGPTGHWGTSSRDWYSAGWSSMKTLVDKGLVVKSSNPGKYKLTDEGKDVARTCLLRSGLSDGNKSLDNLNSNSKEKTSLNLSRSGPSDGNKSLDSSNLSSKEKTSLNSDRVDRLIVNLDEDSPDVDSIRAPVGQTTQPTISSKKRKKSIDVPPEYIDKYVRMGYLEQHIRRAFSEAAETYPEKDFTLLGPTVLACLKEDDVYSVPTTTIRDQHPGPSSRQAQEEFYAGKNMEIKRHATTVHISQKTSVPSDFGQSSNDHTVANDSILVLECKPNSLRMPPLTCGETFGEVYEVVLILDDREQFANKGPHSQQFIEGVRSEYKILIEVKRLPVGDAIWIARHKSLGYEYVLDFIVERKKVDDLRTSIRDNRYRDQKLRLVGCGLKKMIYLLEGDSNAADAAESIKTACFTTEIMEGFDIQRTNSLKDTMEKYAHLTRAINQCYRDLDPDEELHGICPTFEEFTGRCKELDKTTVSDLFAIQLMQVPQVTEDVALAVLNMYPTLLSLARAYSHLDGDISAQEAMLKTQSNNVINGSASRNIFKLVWGS